MNGNEKKKSISAKKLFLIVYICIFGIKLLIDLFSELSSGGEDLPIFWMIIIIDAVVAFIFLSPFWLIVKAVKSADKNVKEESMSKIDFVNSKEYYRDILKKYSPAELSYTDDFNIDYSKDIIATLLSLKLKKKITITNNFVNVIDFNDVGLRKTEKYILECIKDGKVKLKHSHDIMHYAQEEALMDNLLIKVSDNASDKKMKRGIFIFIGVFILFYFFCLYGENFINEVLNSSVISGNMMFIIMFLISILLFAFFAYGPLFLLTRSATYSKLKENSYKRTKNGEEINRNIEGLKNYIKDFSILAEREQHELMIWDEYLIYSVLFNQNQKIINDLSSLVEAEYEVGKVYFEQVDKNSSNNN